MAHTITEECINCGACDESCPVNAISEAGDKRAIDAETCIDCGSLRQIPARLMPFTPRSTHDERKRPVLTGPFLFFPEKHPHMV